MIYKPHILPTITNYYTKILPVQTKEKGEREEKRIYKRYPRNPSIGIYMFFHILTYLIPIYIEPKAIRALD